MREHDRLLEELRLLLDALAGRAEEYLRGCEREPRQGETGCGWCPLCAAVALARGQRPELSDQLLGIVQVLRQALVDHAEHATAEQPEEPEPEEPKVQRIQVQRVAGPVLAESDAVC
ncbi:hypothetical protein EIL87_19400 [Saccharopolyspora rhizosphaerae]|uniref:Uncharacterized protein n=1 Tax=Saccharopolyspora rhizosphaerae TaxID=2492662 RepID=A0A3R8QL55_9PSEU|nr:hypothetical protein [Saccharopolyspora rhizosphaerae]RRO14887.1 hypothetical protein EIL87_19400 [Saccharopolyspora rhizosphaerae]